MKTFLITFTEGPRTRWNAEDDLIAHTIAQLCGSVGHMHTNGEVPAVSVVRAKPYNICQGCHERLAVQNELCPECLTAARKQHAETYAPKACRCEICTEQTGKPV